MKTIKLLILVVIFMAISGFQPNDKKGKREKERREMSQLIQSGRFKFVARSATSELGTFNHLSSGYDLIFDSLQVVAYLPYYGRVYSVQYNGEGGVKFDLQAKNIDKKWDEKRGLFTISAELADSNDSYSLLLKTSLNGYADLRVTFRNRSWISYYGIIEKNE